MSLRTVPGRFSAFRPERIVAAAAMLAALAVGGCAGVSIEDAVPTSAVPAAAGPVGTGPSAPRDTGSFPNLNVPPQSAAEQISTEERATTVQSLRDAQASQEAAAASVTASPDDTERLRRLGATHAADTLRQIEGE